MRFGIVGTGRITKRLVADLQSTDGVSVEAIASRQATRADWFASQYGLAAGVEGYQPLLEREGLDAVYIALPPAMHYEWAMRALNAGKHVLCEKPLAVTKAQVSEMIEAAQRRQLRILDATGWLHHARTDAMKRWIDEGQIGTLKHVSVAVSFYEPFQSDEHRLRADLGGGCLLDLGWYCGGLARWAIGRMPVAAYATCVMGQSVPQRLTAILWFDDDVTATLSCGYDSATRKWFEVAGSKASIICDDFTRPWPDRPARCWIHDASGSATTHGFEDDQERRMIERFSGTTPIDPLLNQAIDTQAILDGIDASLASGSRVTLDSPSGDRQRQGGAGQV